MTRTELALGEVAAVELVPCACKGLGHCRHPRQLTASFSSSGGPRPRLPWFSRETSDIFGLWPQTPRTSTCAYSSSKMIQISIAS